MTAALALVAGCANAEPEPDAEAAANDTTEEDTDDAGEETDGEGSESAAAETGYEHLDRALAGEFDGTEVSIMSQWIAEDGERFVEALSGFEADTGIDITVDGVTDYTTTLVARAEGGNPPDLAQVAQPGLMRTLAENGHLVALSDWMDTDRLTSDFGDAWLEMTSADGEVYGVTWGAFTKSVVWYPAPAFEEAGYEVPTTWDELTDLTEQIKTDGNGAPWCISVEQGDFTGWPATDWIEDVLLRTASPETYDAWAAGELPFSDPAVKNAFDITADVFFSEGNAYGGSTWMNETWVGATPLPMFHGEDGPDCWLHKQATWIADFFLADPNADADDPDAERLAPGEDAKFFVLPGIDEEFGTPVLGAADQFVMFTDRPEVRAVLEYLATPEALEPMIAGGGFISANESVPADWYQDYSSEKVAEILAEASALRDDASDGMPAAVGSGFNAAMVDWIRAEGTNTDEILARLDALDWEGEE